MTSFRTHLVGVYDVGQLLRIGDSALLQYVNEMLAVDEQQFNLSSYLDSLLRFACGVLRAALVQMCDEECVVNTAHGVV